MSGSWRPGSLAADLETGSYTQHYFDSRGVVRLYAMTFADGVWTLTRESPDFTPLEFRQRFTGRFGADGNTISGAWEKGRDGGEWEHDFTLTYRRAADGRVWAQNFERFGPQVIGRTMFDFGYPHWGENPPFHAPVFVVTHRGQEVITKGGGTSFTFVTGGIKAAVEQARAVADGKDVLLAGGVSIARQALAAGPVDEVVLHVVPKLIGRGVRLFGTDEVDLRCVEVIQGEGAVHLRYEVQQ